MAAAYAALVSLMNVIHDLQHHPPPSISLHHQPINPINQHIIFFLGFFQAYSADNDQESADPLVMRIANAAYAAEDAIESHIVDSIQLSMEPINSNDEKSKSIILCRDLLQTVIKEMDSIKNLVVNHTKEKKKEMAVVQDQVPVKSLLTSISRIETMVGLDVASREIMEKLTGDESNLQITPIVGMGGIGKTFLAQSIYAEPFIKEHFYICAWATISQQYNTRDILCEILSQVTKQNKEGLCGSENELGEELFKYLFGRRFLIVLDDMWSAEAWDKIRRFFPNKENGSRVLVTTRLSQLSSQLNHDYSLHMSFLDKSTSWDLFSKTVFGDKRSCPHELKEIGEQIVDNCRGLPLSIVVVGGLLKKTDYTQASWKSIRDNLSSVVNMEKDKHCLKLLKMSYNHLPIYLKPCFLYMGVFKEDHSISVSMLIKLWVSEGFLKPSNVEAMETTAREFMNELVDRNLILIHKLGSTGKIKYCKIHDLVRDLCLIEGQKDGLFHVVGDCNPLHPQEMNTLRRVVIPMNASTEIVVQDDQLRSMSNARSVICEYGHGDILPPNLGLLRTVHAYKEYDYVERYYVNMLTSPHVNLRHLAISIKDGDMSSFLHPVSLLWNLHTLIIGSGLRETITLPFDIWKMPQFRHIEFVDTIPKIPSNEGDGEFIIMENLVTLKGVSNFKCCEGTVKRIPNIKKLELEYGAEDEGDYFLENIKSLCRLESLNITYYFSIGYKMQNLSFPQSLRKLCLTMNNYFDWDDCMLESISLLPLVEKLKLIGGRFGKGKWETVEGQFPCLKYLELVGCEGLENWTSAEEGSNILPRLEYLSLDGIISLEEIPLELGNIDTLKKIELFWCGGEAVRCAKEMVDEQLMSQGHLCFDVRVTVRNKSLKSLAGPHFEVDCLLETRIG